MEMGGLPCIQLFEHHCCPKYTSLIELVSLTFFFKILVSEELMIKYGICAYISVMMAVFLTTPQLSG